MTKGIMHYKDMTLLNLCALGNLRAPGGATALQTAVGKQTDITTL